MFDEAIQCESCGEPAKVRLRDGSTWCLPCHASALGLSYDHDIGTAIFPLSHLQLVEDEG